MPRVPTVEVSRPILNSMFRKFNIWHKIRNGTLTTNIADSRPSYKWTNATSEIIKHFTPDGKHIATTHRVRDTTGRVLHWDAKDFRLKNIRYWRV
jgi:hypothetical protein